MWKLRSDCKEGIFLCSEYRKFKGDIFSICKKCLTACRQTTVMGRLQTGVDNRMIGYQPLK